MTSKLLIIGTVFPEPNSSAAGSRMLQLIELFQQRGWEVTFQVRLQKVSLRLNGFLPAKW